MRSLAATAFVFLVAMGIAHAQRGPQLGLGGVAGISISTAPYFPAYFLGVTGDVDVPLDERVAAGVVLRGQYYAHPEDEDFGSTGAQVDLSVQLRLDLVPNSQPGRVRPFLALHAGVAYVHRVPICAACTGEDFSGVIAGGSLGVEVGSQKSARVRLQISFDVPSFSTHDDVSPPAAELSGGIAVAWSPAL